MAEAENEEFAIVADNAGKRFGRAWGVRGASLRLRKGGSLCIVGPNGSGKTTLLNLLTGALIPDEGTVRIQGRVGYCRQKPGLFEDLSVGQNMELFERLGGEGQGSKHSSLVLKRLSLSVWADRRVSELSAGLKKRAELAASLCPDPDILVLDEPTTGLDPESREQVRSLLLGLKGKRTIVVATHRLDEVKGICGEFIEIAEGKIRGAVGGKIVRE